MDIQIKNISQWLCIVTGFLIEDRKAQFGRLAGVAVAADGGLLFTDDENGVIYRVRYTGSK